MLRATALATLMVIGATGVAHAWAPWKVGEEREVKPGAYYTLVSEKDGWRLWRHDYKSGHECVATKSAKGKAPLAPLGTGGYAFAGGYPAILIHTSSKIQSTFGKNDMKVVGGPPEWTFVADYEGATGKYRVVGERFWEDQPYDFDPIEKYQPFFALDGKQIEVAAVSYKYPKLGIEGIEQKGILDLRGMAEVTAAVQACSDLPTE